MDDCEFNLFSSRMCNRGMKGCNVDHLYGLEVSWSKEDECFIARCPMLPGMSAFGDTKTEALKEGRIALALFIESIENC